MSSGAGAGSGKKFPEPELEPEPPPKQAGSKTLILWARCWDRAYNLSRRRRKQSSVSRCQEARTDKTWNVKIVVKMLYNLAGIVPAHLTFFALWRKCLFWGSFEDKKRPCNLDLCFRGGQGTGGGWTKIWGQNISLANLISKLQAHTNPAFSNILEMNCLHCLTVLMMPVISVCRRTVKLSPTRQMHC